MNFDAVNIIAPRKSAEALENRVVQKRDGKHSTLENVTTVLCGFSAMRLSVSQQAKRNVTEMDSGNNDMINDTKKEITAAFSH